MLLHTSLNHSGQPTTQRVEHSPGCTERIGQADDGRVRVPGMSPRTLIEGREDHSAAAGVMFMGG